MLVRAEFGDWFVFVVAILCVWRLTALICYEEGPFHIVSKLRKLLYHLRLGALVECFYCMSVWTALLLVLALTKPGPLTVILVFSISGGASIIERAFA